MRSTKTYSSEFSQPCWQTRSLVATTLILGLAIATESQALAQRVMRFSPRGQLNRFQYRRDNGEMLRLLEPLSKEAGKSVVRVFCGGKPVALGVIVSSDGFVLTKRSQLTGDPVRVQLNDNSLVEARVASVRRVADLALLSLITDKPLPHAEFVQNEPQTGHFLISAGRGGTTIGLGAVGTVPRPIARSGKLGVMLSKDGSSGRAVVDTVLSGSGAENAGIEVGDLIVAVNGREQDTDAAVKTALGKIYAGEMVHLTIIRSGDRVELDATIGEGHFLSESEQDEQINGPRSKRISGFEKVFQHDTVLEPNECGGPVLNSRGQIVGINIARAGRVVSYALPASVVVPNLNSMLAEKSVP